MPGARSFWRPAAWRFAALAALLFSPQAHAACLCGAQAADIVFSGVVTNVLEQKESRTYTLLVADVWKGENLRKIVHVQMSKGVSNCESAFREGNHVLVYASVDEKGALQGSCSLTAPYETALEQRTQLKEPLERRIPCL